MNGDRGYEETRSALTGRLVRWCVIYPAAAELLFLVLAVTVNVNWVVPMGPAFVAAMIAAGFAYRNWPTGIRIDESGITIGAITSRRARSRRPTVYHQSWGIYTCPWAWIQDAQVVSSPEAVRAAAKGYHTLNNQWGGNLSMTRCDIGVMTAPFARSALVVEVWPLKVTGTAVRAGRGYTNFRDGHLSRKFVPQMSTRWIVPTRQPSAVDAALRRYRPADQPGTRAGQ